MDTKKNCSSQVCSESTNSTRKTDGKPTSNCFLCHTPGQFLYTDIIDHLFDVEGQWSLARCNQCGLIWIDPKPALGEIDGFYENYHTHEDSETNRWIDRIVWRGIPAVSMGYWDIVTDPLNRILGLCFSMLGPCREVGKGAIKWLPANRKGRLLDVGCGNGYFLGKMQVLGWDVYGVEPNRKAALKARSLLNSEAVFISQLESIDFDGQSMDVITMNHVVEHLLEPVKTLERCFKILKPGGLLIITTPNSLSLGSKKFEELWRGWEPPRHIHIFNPESLASTVRKTGFHIRMNKTPSSASYYVWLQSLLLKKKALSTSIVKAQPTSWLKFQSVFFWLYEYLLTRFGMQCAEEIHLIAERPEYDGEKNG